MRRIRGEDGRRELARLFHPSKGPLGERATRNKERTVRICKEIRGTGKEPGKVRWCKPRRASFILSTTSLRIIRTLQQRTTSESAEDGLMTRNALARPLLHKEKITLKHRIKYASKASNITYSPSLRLINDPKLARLVSEGKSPER